jgi:hypothetical protein
MNSAQIYPLPFTLSQGLQAIMHKNSDDGNYFPVFTLYKSGEHSTIAKYMEENGDQPNR